MSPNPTSRDDRWFYERSYWNRGLRYVAGVDEVGRGPLAGPVVAVAAILDPSFDDPGVTDSKAVTPARRLAMVPLISDAAVAWGVGVVGPEEIDRYNILNATFMAMRRALACMPVPAQAVLVDGRHHIPQVDLPQRAIVGGDRDSLSIGAASILAKEVRDRIMEEYDLQHPGYGFARHKGYGTPEHTEALARLGPTPIHRKSFAPLRLWQQNRLDL
ncbi:MAG TPA: ribonuclease HII [Acidobacteriota bacterium]|nr:ribonuclease HII [Acidobacteriota bacterium]